MMNNNKTDEAYFSDQKIILKPSSPDGRLRRDDVKMYEILFQNVLDTFFYIKDISGLWISCNAASLELLNLTKISEVIGIKEDNFFPKQIAEDIRKDDLNILNNAQSVLNRIELIANQYGELVWVNTNKLPIFDDAGKIIGLVGMTKLIAEENTVPQKFSMLNKTIKFINANLANVITISDLADLNKLSESQFRRNFQRELGVSPQQFILRARLQASAHLLRSRSKSISVVAFDCGFSDQSYFSRQFKKFFGKTPKEYQKLWYSRF